MINVRLRAIFSNDTTAFNAFKTFCANFLKHQTVLLVPLEHFILNKNWKG